MTTKININQLSPETRIHNYDEVVLCYTKEQALAEANRCINCVNHPCVDGCPIHNNIPGFISKIKEKDYQEAYNIISSNSPIPSVCSRVCPQEQQCQKNCTRGINGDAISIGALERFICDNFDKSLDKKECNNHSIAIIGSGPSGLACAKELLKLCYDVTIFEEKDVLGGILTYGIPEFRLPIKVVEKEIDKILNLGLKVEKNKKLGKDVTIEELLDKYECIYICVGTPLSKKMGIPGEDLNGFYVASDFLYKANLQNSEIKPIIENKKVVVVGGGNVAMDVARSAVRLGAKSVDIVYRRSLKEMPAYGDELKQAQDEQISLNLLVNPVEIVESSLKNGQIRGVKCIKMQLGEPDEQGRARPTQIPGSEFVIDADIVIEAISTAIDPSTTQEIEVNKYGYPVVDENGRTSNERVFAGGDFVSGPSTVVNAVKAGKLAAAAINEYIKTINK